MSNKDFFVLLIRLCLGYIFLSSGLCKLTEGQFAQLIGPPLLIEQLEEYGLELFGYIIAISQVLIGGLVMTQRFSLIGLIALVPINFGILSVTLSQQWTGTPFVNAFFLGLNIIALIYEYPSLKILLQTKATSTLRVPKSIQLFTDWRFPVALLLLLGVGIGASFFSLFWTTLIGSIFFALLGYYLFWAQAYHLLQALVLGCFFICILMITNIRGLQTLNIRGEVFFVGSFAVGFAIWLISLFAKSRLIGPIKAKGG